MDTGIRIRTKMSRVPNTGLNIVIDGWLFRNLSRRLEETPSIWFTSLAKKNDRKQVAQKFYSLLVLQKVNNSNPGLHISRT
jgi:hypothetical protein